MHNKQPVHCAWSVNVDKTVTDLGTLGDLNSMLHTNTAVFFSIAINFLKIAQNSFFLDSLNMFTLINTKY